MAEDQNESGAEGANDKENPAKAAISEDEAEKKEQEEVDKAMDEIAKFVDQFNDKDSKDKESKESTPIDEDPESNHSIRLVLEDSQESRDLKTDDKEAEGNKEESKTEDKDKEDVTEVKDEDARKVSSEEEPKVVKNKENDESKAEPLVAEEKEKGEEKERKKENLENSEKVEKKEKEKEVVEEKEKEKEKEVVEKKDKEKVEKKDKEKDKKEKSKDKVEEKKTEEKKIEKIIIKINKKSDHESIVISASTKCSEPEKKVPESKDERSPDKEPSTPKDKKEEPEVGIVGLPAAASEVLSEAELLAGEKPSLPTEAKPGVPDRVVQWVETTKADEPVQEAEDSEEEEDEEEEEDDDEDPETGEKKTRGRKRKTDDGTNGAADGAGTPRKAQKVVTNIIRRSIRCLNKMHAMDSSGGNGKKIAGESVIEAKTEDEDSRKSPKVPQGQQNGAALPEETASADRNIMRLPTPIKKERDFSVTDSDEAQVILTKSSKAQMNNQSSLLTKANRTPGQRGRPSLQSQMLQQREEQQLAGRETRKRRSAELLSPRSSSNGNPCASKRLCMDQREQYINSLIGSEKFTADQLATKAEQLRGELQDLDELARAKEMEWNEILSLRKLKEEAFLRLERRRQVLGYMEGNGPLSNFESNVLPPASLVLTQHGFESRDRALLMPKEEQRAGSASRDGSPALRRERTSKTPVNFQQQSKQQYLVENGPRLILDPTNPEHRQIGEGRQGAILSVKSIIADYRLKNPDIVPTRVEHFIEHELQKLSKTGHQPKLGRGRRMRNSINVGLGAGGAMVETMDSRPSSADSCKSASNINDPNNAMSFKDVLVQFAKLSQQQGEPIKTPQNYPDVTLHPVAPTQTAQNSSPQSGSLLHGILTKSQSPRPTNFSPTLARLLTAPERERNAPTITTNPHQTQQQIIQSYQGANPVTINDFLASSKARTEITITPVVNSQIQSHSSNLIHIDDQDDDNSVIEERDSRLSIAARDTREEKDPPRCQGCHERSAQFVCAGCGNQWYCSRECQVAAWDDHSDHCSG